MRLFALMAGILLAASALAQPAIPLEKAILESRGELAPEQLKGLAWLPESDLYTELGDNTLKLYKPTGKLHAEIALASVSPSGDALERWPRISWESDEAFTYRRGNQLIRVKSMDGNRWGSTAVETIARLPQGTANSDRHAESGHIAYTQDNNLFVLVDGKAQTVTQEPEGIVSGQAIARYEFGIGKGTFWSPNGKRLAFYQKDERHVTDYPLTDYSTVPASVNLIKYPMAGSHSEHAAVGIWNVKKEKAVYLDFSKFGTDDQFYATNLSWTPDGKHVLVAVVNRDQDDMQLARFDVSDGKLVDVLYHETDKEYVEPEHPAQFLPDGKSFLWQTEQSGFNNLLHLAYPSGEVLGKTTAEFPITSVLHMGPKGHSLVVQATGKDATQSHIYRIDLKRYTLIQLTRDLGVHNGMVSASGKYIIDRWSNLDTPGVTEIIDARGKQIQELLVSRNPLNRYAASKPEVFQRPSFDGEMLWCRMIKPTFFDPTKQYPVLVYVYNGPHVQLVDKRWGGKAPLWMYTLAEEGYIVFTVDGRGSDNRGADFEQAVHRNLGTTEVLDQEACANWLRSEPYTDPNRFAVHGWSYGGFMTTSLMLKTPGLFQVGVAGGPVIDWSYYEVMYTERYMDTPEQNPEGFSRSDLKQLVRELDGDLLMIHGSIDDVVVMQHNVDFQRTCVDEGVQVDFYMYPGHPHNVRGKDRIHLMTKVFEYIKLHL